MYKLIINIFLNVLFIIITIKNILILLNMKIYSKIKKQIIITNFIICITCYISYMYFLISYYVIYSIIIITITLLSFHTNVLLRRLANENKNKQ